MNQRKIDFSLIFQIDNDNKWLRRIKCVVKMSQMKKTRKSAMNFSSFFSVSLCENQSKQKWWSFQFGTVSMVLILSILFIFFSVEQLIFVYFLFDFSWLFCSLPWPVEISVTVIMGIMIFTSSHSWFIANKVINYGIFKMNACTAVCVCMKMVRIKANMPTTTTTIVALYCRQSVSTRYSSAK